MGILTPFDAGKWSARHSPAKRPELADGMADRSGGAGAPVYLSTPRALSAPEAVMIAAGSVIQIGPDPADCIAVEALSLGDAVWDCAAGRMVDIFTIACATLGPRELADQGLRAVSLGPHSRVAVLANRLRPDPVMDQTFDGRAAAEADVFFRIWPDTRTLASIGQLRCVLMPYRGNGV